MTTHDIQYFSFYDNDDQSGFEESTIVAMEKAAPWESRHIPITTHGLFLKHLNEAIALREAQLRYLTGLKIIAHYVSFEQLRADAEKRGSLESIVNEFWTAYEEN